MIERPDLDFLDTFLAVVRSGGFARAADVLGVTQPAVSYRIGRLEAQLNTKLFESPRRRVILTADGQRLHGFCDAFFGDLDELLRSITANEPARTPLRIACPGAFGRNVVFPALSRTPFADRPVELLFRQIDDIFRMVESGAVDLGIAYDVCVTSTLDFRLLGTEEFVLIAAPGERPRASATLEEISAEPFVMYEECDYVFGRWFGDVYGSAPRHLTSTSVFSRIEEVVARVRDGHGLSIVPSHALPHPDGNDEVAVIRPTDRPRSRNREYAVTRPGWSMRPDADALLREIEAACG